MKDVVRDVVIIGAGAAGLMCAIEAGRRGRSVVILEHNERVGRKVRVSGGGHCNFTNLNIRPENYISQNLHFCKSALAGFKPGDFITLVEQYGIKYHEKESGQLFCNTSSDQIIRMLMAECRDTGTDVILMCRIMSVQKNGKFVIKTDKGIFSAYSLVIATGGLSYKTLGASDLGFRIAGQFGISVTPLKPGLVPLTFSPADTAVFSSLSGISIDAEVSCGDAQFRGPVLFTHRGLSGPAILQISSYWKKGDSIIINLLPEEDIYPVLMDRHGSKIGMQSLLSGFLPKRFSNLWCDRYALSKPLSHYNQRELQTIANHLHSWTITPVSTEGYERAEVTLGGIDTSELSSKTMESKKVAGLFYAGEVIDMTGHLGGYNLHWAWASGHTAGKHV